MSVGVREVLVLNPNTTESMTQLLRRHVQGELGSNFVVGARTARFGAPYIADEASYAVAGHAVLDAFPPPPPGEGWGGGRPVATDALDAMGMVEATGAPILDLPPKGEGKRQMPS